MSMTPASNEYFRQHANDWDNLRSGYFTTAVRDLAMKKAYLRPEMVVADVGAGTGFLSAGLAGRVQHVHLLDASAEMLETARQNLAGHNNVSFHTADGLALPLPDASLDAAFANMYLHHCPEPLASLKEMVRLLKPGGRLVITDMDSHPYAWLKDEMADVWQGFERSQIRAWFQELGLVNVLVTNSGETCDAESQICECSSRPGAAAGADCCSEVTDAAGEKVSINIFLATGTLPLSNTHQQVQEHYGALAVSGNSCCGSSASTATQTITASDIRIAPVTAASAEPKTGVAACCTPQTVSLLNPDELEVLDIKGDYSAEEKAQAPQEAADFSLGCGNPVAFASLQPGETVVDIGSGGGLDSFLAAGKVGLQGKVIGVDMTPTMLERARQAAQTNGYTQVEFRQGYAEALPVEDNQVDVILSNCVINLTEDKGKAFAEAFRVLRPGGRLEISDMVTNQALPLAFRLDPGSWAACISGALPEAEYLDLVAQAGFEAIQVRRSTATTVGDLSVYSMQVSARKPK